MSDLISDPVSDPVSAPDGEGYPDNNNNAPDGDTNTKDA